jgi:HEAT repeat protein
MVVKTVCIAEDATYEEMKAKPDTLPDIPLYAGTILRSMGIKVADKGEPCDAVLNVKLTAKAVGAPYTCGYNYTGYELTGSTTLSTQGKPTLTRPFQAQLRPPEFISIQETSPDCNTSPEDAPFNGKMEPILLQTLAEFWGARAYVEALHLPITKEQSGLASDVLMTAQPDEELINALICVLPTEQGRNRAMQILGEFGPEASQAVPYLWEILFQWDVPIFERVQAAATLQAMNALTAEAIPTLYMFMSEGQGRDDEYCGIDARGSAAWLLGSIRPVDEPRNALVQALASNSEVMRSKAVYGLEAVGSEALPYIVQALSDNAESVRCAAAGALKRIGPEAVPAIIQAMTEAPNRGRKASAEVLEYLVGPGYGQDPEAWSRWWQEMVAVMDTIDSEQEVYAALEHQERIIRSYAITEIVKLGPQASEAVPGLIEILKNEPELSDRAAKALSAIGAEAVPALIQTMATVDEFSEQRMVKYWSINALGEIGPPAMEAVPVLIANMEESSIVGIDNACLEALKSITGKNFGDHPDAWKAWWEEQH